MLLYTVPPAFTQEHKPRRVTMPSISGVWLGCKQSRIVKLFGKPLTLQTRTVDYSGTIEQHSDLNYPGIVFSITDNGQPSHGPILYSIEITDPSVKILPKPLRVGMKLSNASAALDKFYGPHDVDQTEHLIWYSFTYKEYSAGRIELYHNNDTINKIVICNDPD